jgi:hypothetical protein
MFYDERTYLDSEYDDDAFSFVDDPFSDDPYAPSYTGDFDDDFLAGEFFDDDLEDDDPYVYEDVSARPEKPRSNER